MYLVFFLAHGLLHEPPIRGIPGGEPVQIWATTRRKNAWPSRCFFSHMTCVLLCVLLTYTIIYICGICFFTDCYWLLLIVTDYIDSDYLLDCDRFWWWFAAANLHSILIPQIQLRDAWPHLWFVADTDTAHGIPGSVGETSQERCAGGQRGFG